MQPGMKARGFARFRLAAAVGMLLATFCARNAWETAADFP